MVFSSTASAASPGVARLAGPWPTFRSWRPVRHSCSRWLAAGWLPWPAPNIQTPKTRSRFLNPKGSRYWMISGSYMRDYWVGNDYIVGNLHVWNRKTNRKTHEGCTIAQFESETMPHLHQSQSSRLTRPSVGTVYYVQWFRYYKPTTMFSNI